VTIVNAKTTTPSLLTLLQYDAIFSWPTSGYYDAIGLGTAFKSYVDSGRGLVLAMFALDNRTNNDALRGSWNNNYAPLIPQNTYLSSGQNVLVPLISSHPILQGVNSFNGGSYSFRGGAWNVNATRVASWSDGTPLVGVLQVGNSVRVDLSFYPVSSDAGGSGYWIAATDGARLMANAILYTINNTGSCSAYTNCGSCASARCQWCLDSNTCSTPNTSCPDRIVNPSDCPINCNYSNCTSCLAPEVQSQCSWCLDNYTCVPAANSNKCSGDINNRKFCPPRR